MRPDPEHAPARTVTAGRPGADQHAGPAEGGTRLRRRLAEQAHQAATTPPAALLDALGALLQLLYALAAEAGHSPAEIEPARARLARARDTRHQPKEGARDAR